MEWVDGCLGNLLPMKTGAEAGSDTHRSDTEEGGGGGGEIVSRVFGRGCSGRPKSENALTVFKNSPNA